MAQRQKGVNPTESMISRMNSMQAAGVTLQTSAQPAKIRPLGQNDGGRRRRLPLSYQTILYGIAGVLPKRSIGQLAKQTTSKKRARPLAMPACDSTSPAAFHAGPCPPQSLGLPTQ
jgi:hypothetical protein